MTIDNETRTKVQEYYGRVLQKSQDLKTNACCCADEPPEEIKAILSQIHEEITSRFYGCGSPFPPALERRTVLDLGCGTGRDAYVLSALVGEKGHVIGIDMTPNQIEVARKHQDYHANQFGYGKSNVTFVDGYIEDLSMIEDCSVDLVVSNCVVNLSRRKDLVLSEIFRVLKPGGELYFSDVFADRRIPEVLMDDEVLLGECLSGAMYVEDFRRFLRKLGCLDYRIMTQSPITIDAPEIEEKIGDINFSSICVRAFKLDLEDICEDYGQVAIYKGTIPNHPHSFVLDDHHTFYTGKPMLVCGNSADMVGKTHYAPHFTIIGDKSKHFGKFDACDPTAESTGLTGCC